MRAVQLDGPNGELRLREMPVPRPGAGEVLVRMAAAPINPSDLGSLAGLSYGVERAFPFTPGLEGSGTVVQCGSGVMPRLLRGRRVACSSPLGGNGTWAEYMVTSAQLCVPLGGQVGLAEGAMLLVNPLTALAFLEIARRGEHRALVSTAAASALGGMILRLGWRYGIPVIHVVRRAEQAELIRRRGAEHVLDSGGADFADELKDRAQRLGATLLLDAVAGDMTQRLADAAPYGSTILLYARLSDRSSVIDPRTALLKRLRLEGWFLSNWLKDKNIVQTLRLARRAQSLLGGELQSPVRARWGLEDAQRAVERYAERMSEGKFLLVADPSAVPLEASQADTHRP